MSSSAHRARGRSAAWFPAAAIVAAYLAFMAALVLVHPAARSIDAHETQYAYAPAVLALQARAAATTAGAPPVDPPADVARGVRATYPPGYPFGLLVPYLLVFLAAGKSVLALRLFHLACHAATLPLVYRIGLRAHDDPRDGRATAVLATVLTATYPYYARNVLWTQLPEEAASLPVLVAVVAAYLRVGLRGRGPIALGLLAALASFVKVHLGPLVLLGIAVHRIALDRKRPLAAVRGLAVAGGVFAAALVPLVVVPVGPSEIARWLFTEESVDLLRPSAAGTAGRVAAMAEHALSAGTVADVWRQVFARFACPRATGGLWLALALAAFLRPREKAPTAPAAARTPEQAATASLGAAFAAVGFGLSVLLYFRLSDAIKDLFYALMPLLFLTAAIGATGLLARLGGVGPWPRRAGLAGFAALGYVLFAGPLVSLRGIEVPLDAIAGETQETAETVLERMDFPADTAYLFTGARSAFFGRMDRNVLAWHALREGRPPRFVAPAGDRARFRRRLNPADDLARPAFAERMAEYRATGYARLLWIGCSPAAGPPDAHDPGGATGRGLAAAGWALRARVRASDAADPAARCAVRAYDNPDARDDRPIRPYVVAQYLTP